MQHWPHPPSDARFTWADHGGRFVAAVEDGPLWATQFHPEKSGDAGARLLANWVRSLGGVEPPTPPDREAAAVRPTARPEGGTDE